MEKFMKYIALVFVSASMLTLAAPSYAQTYLYGVPSGGGASTSTPGAYGNTDDPRTRDNTGNTGNNWRDNSQDNSRSNNWREDQSGWRRNNWREDRADEGRSRSYRADDEKRNEKDKNKDLEQDYSNSEDCGMTRKRQGNSSITPCRR
jgi:hypothetical protein